MFNLFNSRSLIHRNRCGSIKTEFIIEAIDKLKETLTKPSVIVLDNARIHHSKLFQSNIEKWQNQGLYIFYLPAYSPHLNRIETLWRHTKYRCGAARADKATRLQGLEYFKNSS